MVGIFWNRDFELKSAVEEREISDYFFETNKVIIET